MQACSEIFGTPSRAVTFGLIGILSACGVAPEQCADSDMHFVTGTPKDLGNDLVLNKSGGSYSNNLTSMEYAYRSVVDCDAGVGTTFVLRDVFEVRDANGNDVSRSEGRKIDAGEAGQEFDAYLDTADFESLVEIKAKAEELGIVMREWTKDEEDCGCAAFYPRLLGDKKPAPERDA